MSPLPHKTIGILGGGQLAKMLAIAAIDMGIRVSFWIDGGEPVVGHLGDLVSGDEEAFRAFCQKVDVILFEHEHVKKEDLDLLNREFRDKTPGLNLLLAGRDRRREKELLLSLEIPCARPIDLLDPTPSDFPIVLKRVVGGYDGKGQVIVKNDRELQNALEELPPQNLIGEAFIPFEKECSLVCVRTSSGAFYAYDLTENKHENGMLVFSENLPESPFYSQAYAACQKLAEKTSYVGVFAVEFFLTKDQKLLANEISPRVHNSGHWTMDGAFTSQFENHIRACLNMQIGSVKSHTKIRMRNITKLKELEGAFDLGEKAKLYLYGKTPREARKMGHVNEVHSPISN